MPVVVLNVDECYGPFCENIAHLSARDVKTTIEIHLGVPLIANATLIPN